MAAKLRIGVGLSGGVDSAAAALLLLESGYEVIGFTMHLVGADAVAARAAAVAARLGIPHRALDVRTEFEALVLQPFVDEYAVGLTPCPCARCNLAMKFGVLWERMASAGCDRIATGHYARRGERDGRLFLRRGADIAKDQSYFLALLAQSQLQKAMFPLGGLLKSEARAKVLAHGLVSESEGESQDLCFLADGHFADFVAARRPELRVGGWIVDLEGRRLGRHSGAFQYTIGQRRGLGLGGGPWFVVRTDLARREVVVGREADLQSATVNLSGVNWQAAPPPINAELAVTAQLRYQMQARPAILRHLGEGRAQLEFSAPVFAVAPGQLAVAYCGDEVVAGGWIVRP
ncbi:MAG TPA: tRNA 2-thiouridine(34) synthase MnmA [Lentisphaeria bacterium]|nr:tRNA 2-thiouridine(34) synthase MnmA [Lentisphaerota bacterium]HQC51588.1 tRNA 2-thiouridine(34) synthase MnmA [Lentisphaeria bacterium]HQL87480.1 tRNA 2-thiouridine(34) synthase MnmA [Lentisphaeria bacterium]